MNFEQFGFSDSVLAAIKDKGFTVPTDVQAKSFDPVLDGKDVIVQSKTGSGKTAAFGFPLIEILKDGEPGLRALVMLPTRELAKQVHEDLESYSKYTNLKYAIVYGGVGMEPQIQAIRHADVLVGTPGRILDHIRQGTLKLGSINFLVLDEADRMLDMGFIDDVRTIMKEIPQDHITMLFSATMPEQIRALAETMMYKPEFIKCESFVEDNLLRQFYVQAQNRFKLNTLKELVARDMPELAIVFCATRGLTDAVARYLQSEKMEAHAIHGGLTQARREQVMKGFHAGKIHILVATDVAARGLDIDNVTHIFNYNVPKSEQEYIHRMGRTARAGKEGKVITLLSDEEYDDFRRIESYFSGKIEKIELEGFVPQAVTMPRRARFGDRVGAGHSRGGYGAGPRREGFAQRGRGYGGRGPSRGGSRGGPSSQSRSRRSYGTRN